MLLIFGITAQVNDFESSGQMKHDGSNLVRVIEVIFLYQISPCPALIFGHNFMNMMYTHYAAGMAINAVVWRVILPVHLCFCNILLIICAIAYF